MQVNTKLESVNKSTLTPIVQKLLQDKTFQVTDYKALRIDGGTIGEVYLIDGSGRSLQANVSDCSWSIVLKIQRPYVRFGDLESWQREVLIYQSQHFSELSSTFKIPRCLKVEEKFENETWIWLERVEGVHNLEMRLEEYALAARHLAHFQGLYLVDKELPTYPWLSTHYWQVKNVLDWGSGALPWLVKMQKYPESDSLFTPDLLKETLVLWSERDQFLDVLNRLPQTLCHRDYFAGNIFVQKDVVGEECTVAIDWDCSGIGMIGEDIADLLGETLVFYDFDLSGASELREVIFENYLKGLRETGWQGDKRLLRLGYTISLALHWPFRIVCRYQKTEDQHTQQRYVQIQRFMLDQAVEARELIKQLRED